MVKLIVTIFIIIAVLSTVLSLWLGDKENEKNHECERGGIDE